MEELASREEGRERGAHRRVLTIHSVAIKY
jgi:hypothetical protein